MATRTSPYTGRPIVDWFDEPYTLRDRDGDKVGDILEVNPDFIVAQSDGGFLGLGERRTYYIPRSYLTSTDGTDWYLNLDKDVVEDMNWTTAPTESRWSNDQWQAEYGYSDQAPHEGAMRMIRFEEDLEAVKSQRQAGEVTITKDVVEETKTIEVPVRREEVHVERRPVTDTTATAGMEDAFTNQGQSVRVPVMEEQVEVRKVARPVEEVEVTKTAKQEKRQVSDTVRKEQFNIEGDEASRTTK
jgi:uncharacterized protein (TIGR02271 family)